MIVVHNKIIVFMAVCSVGSTPDLISLATWVQFPPPPLFTKTYLTDFC